MSINNNTHSQKEGFYELEKKDAKSYETDNLIKESKSSNAEFRDITCTQFDSSSSINLLFLNLIFILSF